MNKYENLSDEAAVEALERDIRVRPYVAQAQEYVSGVIIATHRRHSLRIFGSEEQALQQVVYEARAEFEENFAKGDRPYVEVSLNKGVIYTRVNINTNPGVCQLDLEITVTR